MSMCTIKYSTVCYGLRQNSSTSDRNVSSNNIYELPACTKTRLIIQELTVIIVS